MTAAQSVEARPVPQSVIQPALIQANPLPQSPAPLEMVLPSRIAGIKPGETPKPNTLEARLASGETGLTKGDIEYRIGYLERSKSRDYSQKYKRAIIGYLQTILKTVEQS